MATKKKAVKKKAGGKSAGKSARKAAVKVRRSAGRAVNKSGKKSVKKSVKKPAQKTVKKTAKKPIKGRGSDEKQGKKGKQLSLVARRRALRKRRGTLRLQKSGPSLTSVKIVAGSASRQTLHTRTRILRKRGDIGMLPIDKNVMIKTLVTAGSVTALAERFGTTKQAVSSWFGRRGLRAVDIANEPGNRKKEVL